MPSETSPELARGITEVVGRFSSDAALQDAIGRLTRVGFDRAALSLPLAHPQPHEATPNAGAANPNTEDDQRQARTLGSSTAAAAGAMLGAAAVVATGGAALAAVAAAAGGAVVAGGGVFAATNAADATDHEGREEAAAIGDLRLAVGAKDEAQVDKAEIALREAGALQIDLVRRG
jgi:hypothetical protein